MRIGQLAWLLFSDSSSFCILSILSAATSSQNEVSGTWKRIASAVALIASRAGPLPESSAKAERKGKKCAFSKQPGDNRPAPTLIKTHHGCLLMLSYHLQSRNIRCMTDELNCEGCDAMM